jgi:hypothetical protein
MARDGGDLFDGTQEDRFIHLGWLVEARDLPDELKRRCPNLFRRDGRIKVEQRFDVPAHLG